MKYPKEYLEEIKTRLKVSNVVSKTIQLKKRGKEFVGLSPFKNEKTPSFTVNDEKGFYHCFSTGEHGNIFDFLMKTQNLKFGESVKALANLAGLRPYTFSKDDEIRQKQFKEYISVFQKYVNICHENLINKKYDKVNKYVSTRNLDINTIKKFQLGYLDYNTTLYKEFEREFGEKILKDTGLFYYDEKKKIFVDRFRNRLIFPINNISNNPIAIGGRIIENKDYLAKYINSPETPFFKKGSNLYNLNLARSRSNSSEFVYVVEGYMDVIGMCKNEIENVVANLGTALTEKQILTLNQFFNHIVICFDSDKSGHAAALRAAENSIMNLVPDKKISFLFLPEGEDPDTFVNKYGKNKFDEFTKLNLISIHDFIFEKYRGETENNPSSLAIFEKKLRSIGNSIKDELIKKYVLEFFFERISDLTPHTKSKNTKKNVTNYRSLKITQNKYNERKSLSSIEVKEINFLSIILNNLKIFNENFELLEDVKLFTKENILIFNKIYDKLKSDNTMDLESLHIDRQIIEKINKFSSVRYILEKVEIKKEDIINSYQEIKRDLKNYELEMRIEELEAKFSKDFNETTFNELKELKKLQKTN